MLVDVVVETDDYGRDVQYGIFMYKGVEHKEILRTNIYEFIDEDRLPYVYFDGEIIYIPDMSDVVD